MKFFTFDSKYKRAINQFNSQNVGVTLILREETPMQIGCMHFSKDSVLGMHPATCPQLFLVVDGEGWVKVAGGENIPVQKGTAVFWIEGEEHESGSLSGMTALIIEGRNLDPEKFLKGLDNSDNLSILED